MIYRDQEQLPEKLHTHSPILPRTNSARTATGSGLLRLSCVFASMILPAITFAQTAGNSVSVLSYGADASGSQDSTSAIQSAATTATSAHATLVFPGGTYRVSS